MANSQGAAVATVAVEHGARAALPQYRTRSMLSITLQRLARSYSALWGLCMVCGLILVAVLADVIAPLWTSPDRGRGGAAWTCPPGRIRWASTCWGGTSSAGLCIAVGGTAIYVGIVSIILALLPGIPLGIVAGFYGGRLDKLIMAVMDVILAFPIFLLAIVIMVITGAQYHQERGHCPGDRAHPHLCPSGQRQRPVRQGERVYRGRAGPGAQSLAGLVPPCAAQLHGPDYYYQHALRVDLDPH